MRRTLFILSTISAAILLVTSSSLYAGTGKVWFGANQGGKGCSGTGICQTSSGATVDFIYHEFTDSTAGGYFTSLTMEFNYDEALLYGFMGGTKGGTYVFTDGYTFDHPGDQELGVPSGYTIPESYAATLSPTNDKGDLKIVVTQFTQFPRQGK